MSAVVRPAFYRHMAIALSLFVIVGFSRTYYLRFLTDLPPLTTLVHLHSLVFTAWLLVFIAQTRLVAAQRVDLHMKLGIAARGAGGGRGGRPVLPRRRSRPRCRASTPPA